MTAIATDAKLTEHSYTIFFESDWHIGTGRGTTGLVDAEVARDANGLPYVPGSSIRGVLRDSAEVIAAGLDAGRSEPAWHRWVVWLFGDQPSLSTGPVETPPNGGVLRFGAATYAAEVAAQLIELELLDTVTTIRAGVEIDPATGTAKPDHLRMMEAASATSRLDGTITAEAALPGAAAALLSAAAINVRRLGGKRRRGMGRCSLTISGISNAAGSALSEHNADLLRSDQVDPPPAPHANMVELRNSVSGGPTSDVEPDASVSATEDHSAPAGLTVRLRITAIEPVVIADRVIGNATQPSRQIPGAMMIPILQRGWKRSLWPWLATGLLSVGDGAMADATGRPFTPAPRNLGRAVGDKNRKQGDPELLVDQFVHGDVAAKRLPATAGTRAADETLVVHHPELSTITHNVISDREQRPTEEVGGLFSFTAYQAGSVWVSDVHLRGSAVELADADAVWNRSARIGRATQAGHGLVDITRIDIDDITPPAVNAGVHTLVLTSDAYLIGPSLRPEPSVDRFVDELSASLGGTVELVDARVGAARRESWNRRWVRPRPTLPVIVAGSAIRVSVDDAAANGLTALGAIGIGERTQEGFGRFVVDPAELRCNGLAAPDDHSCGGAIPAPNRSAASTSSETIIRCAVRRARIADTRLAAERQFSPQSLLGCTLGPDVSLTQLGALRQALSGDDWRASLQRWVQGVRSTDNRVKRWSKNLLDELDKLAEDPTKIGVFVNTTQVRGLDSNDPEGAAAAVVPVYLIEQIRLIQDEMSRRANRVGPDRSSDDGAPNVDSRREESR